MLHRWLVLAVAGASAHEWAIINMIRHGERSPNKTSIHLTMDGYARSEYIARCVGDVPSLAFPLGGPTALIASVRAESSVRPLETLKPLSHKLGLPIDNTIDMADVAKVHEYVQSIPSGGTLLLSWQHWFIPIIARSLETTSTGLAPPLWPDKCDYSEWEEPTYTSGACYDAIWQIILFREREGQQWRSQAFSQMHMGYGGRADSPCMSAMYPFSNPASWKQREEPLAAATMKQRDEPLAAATVLLNGLPSTAREPEAASGGAPGLQSILGAALAAAFVTSWLVASAYEGPRALSARLARMSVGARRASPADAYLPPVNTLGAPLLEANEGGADGVRVVPSATRVDQTSSSTAVALAAAAGTLATGAMCVVGVMSPGSVLTSATAVVLAASGGRSNDSFWFDFFAGGFAGAIAKTVSAPIERVKLLIQTQDKIPAVLSGEMARYKGICDCFRRVAAEQGVASFWRGNLPNVLRYFPVAAFNFAFNDMIQGWFPRYSPHSQFALMLCVNLISGGLAGAGSLTIVYPLDYARTRLAADVGHDKGSPTVKRANGKGTNREFDGLADCIRQTVAKNGFCALYDGYLVSVIGIIAYRAPYFGLFDTFNALNPYAVGKHAEFGAYLFGVFVSFCIAQLTSAIAALVSYPFDTVRRRLQMEANVPRSDRLYRGMCHCATTIVATEGADALYKGFVANLLRGASTAFMLVLFNEVAGIKGSE